MNKPMYSVIIKKNGLYSISGQLPVNEEGVVIGDLYQQTKQSLQNIEAILLANNLKKDSIFKMGIFTTEMDQLEVINRAYMEFFESVEIMPSRSAVGINSLVKKSLIEIDCLGFF
ncbi:hypothetical protein RV11_GL000278 [Enterococcus phoeniculicola]|uniref:TdcF protein n=1 Tax=Enterococcus phoeniculicola ATCC BAA-412 TaxID=1158610 RepID=R3W9A1_9ENTE|nr:RidA family protein [Enterococcus phoeniculicola]EOL44022.1 hypothetical protein UC3_01652 [Enterococcus phoeniculicola ATCC BAA-412]EOT75124.1 hypothetical protein I589_02724 [Enterococcus phoeniculicola ATCC BAA-412]OJG71572.1 hypothetical protein RV11_GL000278 [Enterococcus phoeniculicola]